MKPFYEKMAFFTCNLEIILYSLNKICKNMFDDGEYRLVIVLGRQELKVV